MSNNSSILVLGGTGRQGGASARHLLDRGWKVRALVRDQHTPAARALEQLGAELRHGNLNDVTSLRQAMNGVHGVHSVQAMAPNGIEVQQGKRVADVAAELGVEHLVYSSVGGAERASGVPHFETKGEVERHIDTLGIPITVLRPVFFMDNFPMFIQPADNGSQLLSLPLPGTLPLQLIASADIGYFVATAFGARTDHLGKRIEVAGDELTLDEVADTYQRATGIPTSYREMPRQDALESFGGQEGLRMFDWFIESGYQADLEALRMQHPGLQTFESFVRTGN